MKIAVIGSGVSGLTASLIASPHASVTLYESDDRLGGHAHTHTIDTATGPVTVDTGFMVFNPPRYPTLLPLLKYLDVPSVPTTMSFSVSIPETVEYSSVVPFGIFADWTNLFRPSYYRFLNDIRRFNAAALDALAAGVDSKTTLAEFLIDHNLRGPVVDWYLFPMLGAIWSCSNSEVEAFPARATFTFLNNHALLDPLAASAWRTIPGGSRRYVDAIARLLEKSGVQIRLSTHITHVERSATAVTIHTNDTHEVYDQVIFATHADTALSLLSSPTQTERDILGAFTYSTNETILHKNPGFMPQRPAAWASWNYRTGTGADATRPLSVTYDMNSLQHIDPQNPVYVTLNPIITVPEADIYARMSYTHPHFNTAALDAQARLPEIQGKNRTFFTGAHWGYGFHEDGASSAVAATKLLGFTPPWLD